MPFFPLCPHKCKNEPRTLPTRHLTIPLPRRLLLPQEPLPGLLPLCTAEQAGTARSPVRSGPLPHLPQPLSSPSVFRPFSLAKIWRAADLSMRHSLHTGETFLNHVYPMHKLCPLFTFCHGAAMTDKYFFVFMPLPYQILS